MSTPNKVAKVLIANNEFIVVTAAEVNESALHEEAPNLDYSSNARWETWKV